MRAVVYQGAHDVRVENVPDPQIMDEREAILKVIATAICGTDIHFSREDGCIKVVMKP